MDWIKNTVETRCFVTLFFISFISFSHTECVCVCMYISMMIAASVAAWMKSKFSFFFFVKFYAMFLTTKIKTVSHFMCAVMFRFHSPTFYAPFSLAHLIPFVDRSSSLHKYLFIFIVWWFSGFSLFSLFFNFNNSRIMCVVTYFKKWSLCSSCVSFCGWFLH